MTEAQMHDRFDRLEALMKAESVETRAYVDLQWTGLRDYVGLEAKKTREHSDAVAERLETRITLIAEGHAALSARQGQLEVGQTRLETRQDELELRQTRLEKR